MRGPTRKADWPRKIGDRVDGPTGWTGTVLHIQWKTSLPQVKVRWDRNGTVGRHTITQLRRLSKED